MRQGGRRPHPHQGCMAEAEADGNRTRPSRCSLKAVSVGEGDSTYRFTGWQRWADTTPGGATAYSLRTGDSTVDTKQPHLRPAYPAGHGVARRSASRGSSTRWGPRPFAPAKAAKTACRGHRTHAQRAGTPSPCGGSLLDAGAAFFSELEWASTASSAMMGHTSVMRDEHGRGDSDGH